MRADHHSNVTESKPCPCGSGQPYRDCCGPWHAGAAAPTAAALMRSRYSAFVFKDARYLLATWHSSTRPASIEFDPNLRWLRLEVLDAMESDQNAEVEFIARFRIGGGSAARLHERSRFVREDSRWFYVAGETK